MTHDELAEAAARRHLGYALLICLALAQGTGLVLAARSANGRLPFFSANDRSRWSTISALVDEHTYAIDNVRRRPGWKSIDMVRHRGPDGALHYYSSKPPLLPTLLAGQYATIKALTGATLERNPFGVVRTMLLLTNVIPYGICLVLMARWIERHGETDFGRLLTLAAACFGTLLTPFLVTLNNHSPAACCTLLAVLGTLRLWDDEEAPAWLFAGTGFFAAFAAANELPALSLLTVVGATLLLRHPRRTLIYFLPAVFLVGVPFVITTYVAHHSLSPPYAHRQPGDNWYDYPGSYWTTARQGVDQGEPSRLVYLGHVVVGHHGFFSLTPLWCLSLVGGIAGLVGRSSSRRYLSALALGLWSVCVIFYTLLRPEIDRNYGGVASGFRWLFWLIPLWLMLLLPAADWCSETRPRRALALLLLAIAVFSATIPAANPWTHPWLYRLWMGS